MSQFLLSVFQKLSFQCQLGPQAAPEPVCVNAAVCPARDEFLTTGQGIPAAPSPLSSGCTKHLPDFCKSSNEVQFWNLCRASR